MFYYLDYLLADPIAVLTMLLLALPGRLLAISAHEFAHAWVADRCGDPTARMLGRLTLNPMKHLDLLGTLMMLVLGFGWAKPVPINPNNYRDYRRDDLRVSLAGLVMNLTLFALGFLALSTMAFLALRPLGPGFSGYLRAAANLSPDFISEMLGALPGYLYQMLVYFTITNLSLAVFNLLPVPPLDGYHVLNDLLLKRDLFASQRAARTAMGVMLVLMFTGLLGEGLSYVVNAVLDGAGWLAMRLFSLLGLI